MLGIVVVVINVIVTAIGGENSESGAARFATDVLCHKPDVVTIDYALNDRDLGLVRAEQAWRQMIEQKNERLVDRWNSDQVVVIEDEGDLMWDGGEFVDHRHQHGFYGRWLGRTEALSRCRLSALLPTRMWRRSA